MLGLILHKEPPPLTHGGTHIPAELARIVTKALKKNKEERYQVVKELGLDLKSLKQQLEFEAELERTETPESGAARRAATSGIGTITPTSNVATAQTGGASDVHPATSSAEYIAGEIKQHKRGAALVLSALLAVAIGIVYFFFVRSAEASINSVAVLPLVNASNDPTAEYLSDGISESVINNLSQLHNNYATSLSTLGRTAEALAANRRAQDLDPLRIGYKSAEASILYDARRYDEATQVFHNVIKMQPDYTNAHIYLGYTSAQKGQYAEAIAAYQKAISLGGDPTSTLCYLGYAYAKSGRRDEALAVLGKLKASKEHVSPAELAVLYVGLGDREAALELLERAYRERDTQMQYLKVEAHYDPLRSDARFQDLVRRVGLPQ